MSNRLNPLEDLGHFAALSRCHLQLVDDSSPDPQLIPANRQDGRVMIGTQRIYLPLNDQIRNDLLLTE